MSMETFLKVREMGRKVKERNAVGEIDYEYMTAPCGLPCFECFLYLARYDREMGETIAGVLNVAPDDIKCDGCRAEGGCPGHLPMACRVYNCIGDKGMKTCAECRDFPCEYLHPYRDGSEKWHNTKVYHLCRIKKIGLEQWAKNEAGGILDKYFYGTWTL